MELRVLRYFLEAAREGNITHAAERLHISQPTLSKQLKELEGELGKKLFIRGNYNVRLTDEGMLLRKRAEDILEMVDKTEEEFKALGEITGGDIRIGCAESEGIRHLAQRIKAVQAQYPRIRVHLYSGDRSDLAERLEQGLLDFAVLVESNDLSKYNYLPLPGADTWGIILRKDHPLAEREAFAPEDLLDVPLICPRQGLQKELSDWFQEKVDRLNIVATCNLAYNGGVLTQEGLGCLLSFDKLTDTSPDSPLCFRPLMPTLRSKLFFVWKKYAVFSPAAEVLLNEMKDHCSAKEMQGPARMF
ncbi:LysR family transcriptional regulator [Lawsonibacter sp. JLR.KK007]|uniref:LysR substrate-binding domain-containing protein n=1 Tax=Lawsonibacter sp. JLR.KK007 TaxID=3114293 RepID=UPI002FEE9B79